MVFTVTRTYSKKTKAVILFSWDDTDFGVNLTPRQVTKMIVELQRVQKETGG